jgi:hypothetical protein
MFSRNHTTVWYKENTAICKKFLIATDIYLQFWFHLKVLERTYKMLPLALVQYLAVAEKHFIAKIVCLILKNPSDWVRLETPNILISGTLSPPLAH